MVPGVPFRRKMVSRDVNPATGQDVRRTFSEGGIRMPRRTFTISEANALVPVLSEQLDRLKKLQHVAQEKFDEMEQLKLVGKRDESHYILDYDLKLAQEVFERTVAEANVLIKEVGASGCELRNIELGLVDFPAVVEGEDVLLCWQSGESEVLFYHAPFAGFQGRRPLTSGESAGSSGEPPNRSGY